MTRFISVVSGKGGVGKTTAVINLATALSSKFKKDVIIVDCNVTTSHLGLHLGMYYHPVTLNQVLKDEAKITDAMYDYSKVRVIPASLDLHELKGVDMIKLKDAISELSADIVLLDSAPGLGREAISTIRASNEILFVTTPFIPSTLDMVRCNELIKQLNIGCLGVVLNMVEGENYELRKEEIEKISELPVLATIPMDRNIPKSLAEKEPLITYRPKSPASKEFIKLAARLVGEEYRTGGLDKIKRFLGLSRY